MEEFGLFYTLQRKLWHNQLNTWRQHSTFKIVVVTFFATLFFVSLFIFFYRGFVFFNRHIAADFFNLVVDYIFGIFFFVLFVMLFFSSTIIAFSVFFHAKETHYLMTCPLSYQGIFFYKFFETFLVASWAVLFLGVPICFAYAIQQGVSLEFYPLLLLIFIPFVILSSLAGTLATFIIVLYLKKYARWFAGLFLVGFVVGVGFLILSIIQLRHETATFSANWLFGLLDYFNFARHPLSPSTWTYKAMFALAHQEYMEYSFYLLIMYSNTLFFGMLAYILVCKKYPQAWDIVHSTKEQKRLWKLSWLSKLLRTFIFLSPQDRTFLEKDIKIFVRDPLQWSQFAILIGLLLLYILNLRSLQYDQRMLFWKHFITTLNLAATSMILCTFSSRFIFPLLSLEGKRFWILGVMPIERRNILLSKFLFAIVLLVVVSETLMILSCYMLRLPLALSILHAISIFEIALGVGGLAVGLGAIYPNFKEDSPAKIVSGFGGTLNLILGLAYVGVMVSIHSIPSYYILRESISPTAMYFWIIVGVIVTIITSVLPLYIGIKKFQKLEM